MKLITDLVAIKTNPLQTPCKEFDFAEAPFDPLKVGQEMIELMYQHNGLGLAANQVGLKHRIFVMRGTSENGDFIIINPKIVWVSEEQVLLEESCLSFPNLIIKIKRPKHIRLRFAIPNGNIETCKFTGMTARCCQHEIDHLDGILFYKRATKYHRDLGFRQRGKLSDYKENKGLLQQTYQEAVRQFGYNNNEDKIS